MTSAADHRVEGLARRAGADPACPVIDGIAGPQLLHSWAQSLAPDHAPQFAPDAGDRPHSPAEFRCNQVLRNADAFAGVRRHPSSKMWLEPSQRVTIW